MKTQEKPTVTAMSYHLKFFCWLTFILQNTVSSEPHYVNKPVAQKRVNRGVRG